jgi:methionyl-tRNA synthetase
MREVSSTAAGEYITTPIYYVNAEPHLGHTYTTVVADTLARYHRSHGTPTFFVTGTDEHGDKIARAAAAAGVPPQAYVDEISHRFRDTWQRIGIDFDHFIRTTDDYHRAAVQEILATIHARGDIYFGEYGGLYCYGCERFYAERELEQGKCPDHQTEPTAINEANYFFRMSAYQERLLRHVEDHPEFIRPEGYRREVLALLREPIEDLCISRPKSRLEWGIELPFDDKYVTYVWADALVNYVSALRHCRGESFEEQWGRATHLIGKDILKPHAIYWPTMLMAAGLPLFRGLCVHGHWIMEGGKMSKSLGNVVRPLEMQSRYGMDAFRYYLLREMAFGQDAVFSEEALMTRTNADLANGFGNLASRVLAMQQRYFDGAVQPLGAAPQPQDLALRDAFATARREVDEHVRALALHRALEAIWRAIDEANQYVQTTAPFTLAKSPEGRPRAGEILHQLLEALRVSTELTAPFIPENSRRLWELLGLPGSPSLRDSRPWGTAFPVGHRTAGPEVLFPRIEDPAR